MLDLAGKAGAAAEEEEEEVVDETEDDDDEGVMIRLGEGVRANPPTTAAFATICSACRIIALLIKSKKRENKYQYRA